MTISKKPPTTTHSHFPVSPSLPLLPLDPDWRVCLTTMEREGEEKEEDDLDDMGVD